MNVQLIHGDAMEVLRTLPDNSVDAIVTDPPAGISFMGKHWDTDHGGRDNWIAAFAEIARECLRVVKPGAHALVWAIPRTSHWTATAWENGGWECRDRIAHIFGSGFPKSKNLDGGLGSALKPAMEDWWLLRKPLTGTIAANVLEWGTGALNIDACRIATDELTPRNNKIGANGWKNSSGGYIEPSPLGRWPAHLIHDGSDEVVAMFPQTTTGNIKPYKAKSQAEYRQLHVDEITSYHTDDTGSAARFFYMAKATTRDRDEGLEGFEAVKGDFTTSSMNSPEMREQRGRTPADTKRRNTHPCVKNTELMRYLCRLITPAGGVVLDPFCGSGSTGKGAVLEGFSFIGIEREQAYIDIARARIAWVEAKVKR